MPDDYAGKTSTLLFSASHVGQLSRVEGSYGTAGGRL